MERKVKGGTIVGLVGEQKPAEDNAPKAEPKSKKGAKKN